MRILFCGGTSYSQVIKNTGYACDRLGITVLHIPTRTTDRPKQPTLLLKEMIAAAMENFKPDVLIWFICKFDYSSGILEYAKSFRPKLKTVYHNFDDPQHADAYKGEDAIEFDYAITSCEDSIKYYNKVGTSAICLYPPPHDYFHFHNKFSNQEGCRISFVGTNIYSKGKNPHVYMSRIDLVRKASTVGIVHVYGPSGERKTDWQQLKGTSSVKLRGWRSREELPHIYRSSKINLSSHVRPDGYKYLNERTIHIMASGGFLLVDRVNGIEEMFKPGVHCDTWKTKEELVDKIKYWLDHQEKREQVAKNARHLIKEEYSGKRFVQKLLKFINVEY